jgi:hypothetical protein
MTELLENAKLVSSEFDFLPKSFILPREAEKFELYRQQKHVPFILKPDHGSLGRGIEILLPKDQTKTIQETTIAQEYVRSALINGYKFDLRIYVLLLSVDPLRLFVYKDGLVRLCSERSDKNTLYSKITNVSFNKSNTNEISKISKLISEVFPNMTIDTQKMWKDINEVVIKTFIAGIPYLKSAQKLYPSNNLFPRFFQILGFDILLDHNLNPRLLEINYRPSLESHRGRERRMKMEMVRDAIRIAAPLESVSELLRQKMWVSATWFQFAAANRWILDEIEERRKEAISCSKWNEIFTSSESDKYQDLMKECTKIKLEHLSEYSFPAKKNPKE